MVPTPKSVPETTFDDITAAYEETGQLGEVTMVWGSPGGIGLYEKLKQNRVITAVRVYGLKPVLTLNFHTIKQVQGEGLKLVIDTPEGVVAEDDTKLPSDNTISKSPGSSCTLCAGLGQGFFSE